MPIPRCQCRDFQVLLGIFKNKDIKDNSLSWKWINSTTKIKNLTYCNCAFAIWHYTLFYKQHFHKQSQAKTKKNPGKMLSNTVKLDFWYLKIIHILDPPYHPKIIGDILKNKSKNKCVCTHEIIQLIIMNVTQIWTWTQPWTQILSQFDDAYMFYETPKQQLKLNL